MIKQIFAVAVLVSFVSVASAAELNIEERVVGSDTLYSISVDPGNDTGTYSTMIIKLEPESGNFRNYNATGTAGFTPLDKSADETFLSALLGAPVSFGGLGFSVLDSGSSEAIISVTVGSLGSNAASDAPVFLINALLPTDSTASLSINLVDNGNSVALLSQTLGTVPEPTTAILAVLGMVGFAARRRV